MRNPLRAGTVAAALTTAAVLPATAGAALTPSIDAGAKALPDTSWVPAAAVTAAGCDRWVRDSGDDANAGTAAAPWKTPAKALAAATAGQTVCVGSGTYPMPASTSPARGGSATDPIALQGAPGEQKPVLTGTADGELLDLRSGDNFWVLRDLKIDKRGNTGLSVRVIGAHHVALRNVDAINGGEDALQVAGGSSDVDIQGGILANNYEGTPTDRQDAHGLIIEGLNINRVAMRGVETTGNSGDGVQCSALDDDRYGYRTTQPADITIQDNTFHENAENAVDIKSCQRVTIGGSINPERPVKAAKQYFYGFRPTTNPGGNTSNGTAIVVHYAARGVLIENTRIWDACEAIAIGRPDDTVQDVVIRRVLIHSMKGETDFANCKGYGINVQHAQNVEIYHNSIDDTLRPALDLSGPSDSTTTQSRGVRVWNNILSGRGNRAVDLDTARTPGVEMNNNLFHAATRQDRPLERNDVALSLADWTAASGGVLDTASRVGAPDWITDKLTVDFYTRAASPARDIGIAHGQFFCNGAPDAGFRESGCSS